MNNIKASAENSNEQLSRVVIEYTAIVKRLFDQAKRPDFAAADWGPLAELVAVDEFEWAGPFRERMNWQGYVQFLTQWARTVGWDSIVLRIHEWQRAVFVESEERSTMGDRVEVVRTLMVYEFNAADKIKHLAVYLQREHSLGV